jgi:hypothetical protein
MRSAQKRDICRHIAGLVTTIRTNKCSNYFKTPATLPSKCETLLGDELTSCQLQRCSFSSVRKGTLLLHHLKEPLGALMTRPIENV